MMVIIYTGKGGVGKTTVAAATAVRAAAMGHKTIVLSTDTAHSLADAFDLPLSGEPQPILANLWGQEVDVLREMDHYWGTVQAWISALMAWRGLDDLVAEEMAVLPGMEELAGLLYIIAHHDSNLYDVVIVDCAPTGETLKLLSFPEVARWWMERLFPVERAAANILRPIIRPFFNMPIPEDEVFEAVKDLFQRLDRMRSILTDPETASVRLVLNPEKMVIKEAQRTFTYLNLYGYPTDLIVCNRLIPKSVVDAYFQAWKESQERYYQSVVEAFSPVPIARVPLFDQEVVGIPMLHRMGEALFGEEDPIKVFFRGKAHEIHQREDGRYILSIPLPFAEKEQISLMQSGDQLVVQVGNQKRNVVLPRALAGLSSREARLEGETLKISFEEGKG